MRPSTTTRSDEMVGVAVNDVDEAGGRTVSVLLAVGEVRDDREAARPSFRFVDDEKRMFWQSVVSWTSIRR